MPEQNLTDITVLLDRSGSMSSIASDVVGGFTEFVESQRKGAGRAVLSLVQFDSQSIDTLFTARSVHEVPLPIPFDPGVRRRCSMRWDRPLCRRALGFGRWRNPTVPGAWCSWRSRMGWNARATSTISPGSAA